jgi:hypothetical protein
MGAFTSMIHLCTRMCPALAPGAGNHQTAFSSTWTQHSYWAARRYLEQNVWLKFESAVTGHQGLLNAKAESDAVLPKVHLTDDWREVLSGKADVAVVTADSLVLMEEMPEESVDYMFTDPPYDASIQYGELSFLWNAWLKQNHRYAEHEARNLEEITEERFRRIVIETCREVLAERAEPTPYTLLINYVDPKLARLGFFGTLDTGLDVKKVLVVTRGMRMPKRSGSAANECPRRRRRATRCRPRCRPRPRSPRNRCGGSPAGDSSWRWRDRGNGRDPCPASRSCGIR